MRFLWLIWAGIRRNRGRSILVFLQVVIAFTLFGVLQGLNGAINQAIAATHADRLYVGSRLRFGTPLPIALMSTVANAPGVVASTYRFQFGGTWQRPDQAVGVIATDIPSFFAIYPELALSPGALQGIGRLQDGAIVGTETMRKYQWRIGQRIVVRAPGLPQKDGSPDWKFDIVGTYTSTDEPQNSTQLLANYHYIDESRAAGTGTIMLAVARVAEPARAPDTAAAIDRHFANSPNETLTQSERELAQGQVASLGDLNTVVHRVIGASFFVLLFATGALMMQSIRERTPDLAVLKTFGFSDRLVLALVLAETAVLCVGGAGGGLWLASRILPLARRFIGIGYIPLDVVGLGFGFAIILALAAGAVPAWRALRLRVVDALANR